jgi:hypothetical protein
MPTRLRQWIVVGLSALAVVVVLAAASLNAIPYMVSMTLPK